MNKEDILNKPAGRLNELQIVKIHERAVACAERLQSSEVDLIAALNEVDRFKIYRRYRAKSLFQYATFYLRLTESRAYEYITVARKSREVSALQDAIAANQLSVSRARRIASIITPENADHWIQKAKQLNHRELERAIVAENPSQISVHEGTRWLSESELEFKAKINSRVEKMLRRAQDLECQKRKRPVGFGELLEILASDYLKRNDPVEKAARSLKNSARAELSASAGDTASGEKSGTPYSPSLVAKKQIPEGETTQMKRSPLASHLKHAIHMRDGGKCQGHDLGGTICGNSRWVEFHHLKPVAQGGTNTIHNLITLCAAHHRVVHESS